MASNQVVSCNMKFMIIYVLTRVMAFVYFVVVYCNLFQHIINFSILFINNVGLIVMFMVVLLSLVDVEDEEEGREKKDSHMRASCMIK